MRRIMNIALLAATTVAATAACATLGRAGFREPVVALKDVRLLGLGTTGGTADVVLSFYNPNGYRLDATRLTYRLLIDSTQLGEGVMDSRFTVQEKDSTEVRIPVQFTYSGLGAAGRSLLNTGALNYRVIGDVTVGSVVGSVTVPFSQTGRFSTLGR